MSSAVKTVGVRAGPSRIDALDSLAAAQDLPRTNLINEAINNYIELHACRKGLVRNGLDEMRKGRLVRYQLVVKRLKKTGRASG